MYPTPVDIKKTHPHARTNVHTGTRGRYTMRPSCSVFAIYVCSVCPSVCECVSRHLRGERVFAWIRRRGERRRRAWVRASERARARERKRARACVLRLFVRFDACASERATTRAGERHPRGTVIRHGERHAEERATTKPTRERGEGCGGERGKTIDEE